MPEEHTYNQPPAPSQAPQSNTTPNMAPQAPKEAGSSVYPQANKVEDRKPEMGRGHEAFSDFGDGSKKSIAPSVFVWLTFVLVVVITTFFWLSDWGNVKSISEKENEKNQVVAQLSTESNKAAEEQALGFVTAFTELNNLTASNMPKSTLLAELYTHFTRDVKISSLGLTSEGALSISGATGSYRQVADFMLGVSGFDKVSDLSLTNVALSDEEGVPTDQKITFTLTATMQVTKESTASTSDLENDTGLESTSSNNQ